MLRSYAALDDLWKDVRSMTPMLEVDGAEQSAAPRADFRHGGRPGDGGDGTDRDGGTMFVYWDLHTKPFRPLTEAIGRTFKIFAAESGRGSAQERSGDAADRPVRSVLAGRR